MEIKYCKRCVMNNASDRTITFDSNGYCNYCTDALSKSKSIYLKGTDEGKRKLHNLIDMIKNQNKNKKYDCVMGLSGGVDSSYLAYIGYKCGLRILAVHIDDGYDTEVSKKNIKKLCSKCEIELRMIKPDPIQYNALLLAYMKAGVPNLAIPQDNILVAFLYDTVRKEKLKYFLSGGNFALECILQKDHVFNSMDMVNLNDIHRRFGEEPINNLKFISSYRKFLNDRIGTVVEYRPLNYIDYNKDRAFAELKEFCGFEYYGRKHLENIFTAFLQTYWLPKKFGVDKRSSHLSSMIVSGQLSREKALELLEEPLYDEAQIELYIKYICEQMNIDRDYFDKIMRDTPHEHEEYKTDKKAETIRKMLKLKRKGE